MVFSSYLGHTGLFITLNTQRSFTLDSHDVRHLMELSGPLNEHFQQIEKRLGIHISNRGEDFKLSGNRPAVLKIGEQVIRTLYLDISAGKKIDADAVHLLLQEALQAMDDDPMSDDPMSNNTEDQSITANIAIKTPKGMVRPRGANQQHYVNTILSNDINFGIGPAGTGKTYLAVACAVQALEESSVRRILLVRPAVEAGEKLGFLPGDLTQKIDPYLRPLYDALYEMMGFERVSKLIERNVIEVAPLAFMRGRTLNHSFIILDESQNTTVEQMKMFLTRIGFGSTAVITGDITQIDLQRGVLSGLIHAVKVLKNVSGIGHVSFVSKDVVRHSLVQRIVEAYQQYESTEKENSAGYSDHDRHG